MNPRTRLLIAEDSDDIRALLSMALKDADFDVEFARDGIAAVRAVQEARSVAPFDAVVLDCAMPFMDGLTCAEVLRMLEEGRAHSPLRLAFMSGHTELIDDAMLRRVNAEACWSKVPRDGEPPLHQRIASWVLERI